MPLPLGLIDRSGTEHYDIHFVCLSCMLYTMHALHHAGTMIVNKDATEQSVTFFFILHSVIVNIIGEHEQCMTLSQWRIQGGGGPNRPRPPFFWPIFVFLADFCYYWARHRGIWIPGPPPPPLFTDPGSASAFVCMLCKISY